MSKALVRARGICPASEFQDVGCNLGCKIFGGVAGTFRCLKGSRTVSSSLTWDVMAALVAVMRHIRTRGSALQWSNTGPLA